MKKQMIISIIHCLCGDSISGSSDHMENAGKTTIPQYKTEQVRRGELTVIVTATGTLQPTNTVSVGSELSGIIS